MTLALNAIAASSPHPYTGRCRPGANGDEPDLRGPRPSRLHRLKSWPSARRNLAAPRCRCPCCRRNWPGPPRPVPVEHDNSGGGRRRRLTTAARSAPPRCPAHERQAGRAACCRAGGKGTCADGRLWVVSADGRDKARAQPRASWPRGRKCERERQRERGRWRLAGLHAGHRLQGACKRANRHATLNSNRDSHGGVQTACERD
jgi:hypothetical protein